MDSKQAFLQFFCAKRSMSKTNVRVYQYEYHEGCRGRAGGHAGPAMGEAPGTTARDAGMLPLANGRNWPLAGAPVDEVDATLLTSKPRS